LSTAKEKRGKNEDAGIKVSREKRSQLEIRCRSERTWSNLAGRQQESEKMPGEKNSVFILQEKTGKN